MMGGSVGWGYWALPLPEDTLGHADKPAEVLMALGYLGLLVVVLGASWTLWRAWRRWSGQAYHG
jgi:hypothetical protein